jgi:hypothetical protein
VAAAGDPFVRAAANIGFQNVQLGFMRTRNVLLSEATGLSTQAVSEREAGATYGAIAGVGGQVFSATGGFGAIKKGFA